MPHLTNVRGDAKPMFSQSLEDGKYDLLVTFVINPMLELRRLSLSLSVLTALALVSKFLQRARYAPLTHSVFDTYWRLNL